MRVTKAKKTDEVEPKSTAVAKKTKNTKQKVNRAHKELDLSFFDRVTDTGHKQDFIALHKLVRRLAPNLEPTTEFAHGLIGYGKYDYKYKSGKEGTWVQINLAENKQNIALHCCGLLKDSRYVVEAMKDKLGKCSIGKSCVRFKQLSDLNPCGLEDLVKAMADCEKMA